MKTIVRRIGLVAHDAMKKLILLKAGGWPDKSEQFFVCPAIHDGFPFFFKKIECCGAFPTDVNAHYLFFLKNNSQQFLQFP